MKKITWDKNHFYVNGKSEKFVSGSVHYFRIPSEYWYDRLLKLKESGCNCVETYVSWHLHEKKRGEFDFTGMLDLAAFLDVVKGLGLYAVVRPGPYICSECDFGGLPWWLLKTPDIGVRCSDERYLEACTPYLERVCEIIKPYLISNDGPVAFVQIENEYGSYGNDKAYLKWLRDFYISHGIDCAFITSDGAFSMLVKNGTLEGVVGSVNYLNDAETAFGVLQSVCPNQPNAVMELWNGRQDHWNSNRPPRDVDEVKASVEDACNCAEFINLYMFHGGTTWGFMNSIHEKDELTVVTNSYDVDAPIDEFGRRTPKFYAEQEVICKARGIDVVNTATDTEIRRYSDAKLIGKTSLSNGGMKLKKNTSTTILPMESYDQGYGYIIYETEALVDWDDAYLMLPVVHDIAHVYINGEYRKTFLRTDAVREMKIENGYHKISVLVENMGRVQIGRTMIDRKGLLGDIIIDVRGINIFSKPLGYTVYNLPLDTLPLEYSGKVEVNAPAFYKYELEVDELCDTIVNFEGFTRGVVFINGFNLGRHWDTVHTKNRAYIPAPFLKKGKNEIVVFDVLARECEKRVYFGEYNKAVEFNDFRQNQKTVRDGE